MEHVFISVADLNFVDYKWIDTRFSLQDPSKGQRNYKNGHVSGAVYWNLDNDLSDMTKNEGRHPMPEKDSLTELFRNSGLTIDDKIIIYDDGGSPFAARAWWLLQYAGFQQSFISIEGFETIKNIGIPVGDEIQKKIRSNVSPEWNEAIFASRQFIKDTVSGKNGSVLLDARSAERYRGDTEPLDPIAGRIPGALNFDWEQLKVKGQYNMKPSFKEELEKVVDTEKEVAVYCGSGVTAAPLYAMLAHNGYKNIKLYVGSYSDWLSQENVQVEKD